MEPALYIAFHKIYSKIKVPTWFTQQLFSLKDCIGGQKTSIL